MTKERNEKSKYKSPSTGEYCTCAQYLAEIMCTRMAQKKNEGTQAYKFWNTSKWKKTYQLQVIEANRLTNKYDDRAVVAALNTSRGKKIYSLRFPGLEDLIKVEESRLLNESSSAKDYKDSTESQPRKPYGKQTKLGKLRELDG